MRSPRTLSFGVLAALALALPAAAAADTAKPYIVVFEKSSAPAARVATSEIAKDQDLTTTQRYDDAVHGFAAKLDSGDVKDLKKDPRVAEVVPDTPVKATGLVPLATGDNIPTGVRRVGGAVGSTVHQASTANVAVVDTGVDLSHPDLNAVAGTNCITSGATPQDDNGHGTHVAGIIGAKNQGSGAVGVAPGTKIWAVKVLNSAGSGYTSQIVCGIDWVTSTRTDSNPNNDISVVNMSLGGGGGPTANCGTSVGDVEHMAICRATAAGVTFVVAAGNSHTDEQTFEPANIPEALTVTSVSDSDGLPGGVGGTVSCQGDPDDNPANYSNYATRAAEIAHTIAAPGSCIRSTYPGSQYATMSGTSMASPHVAGLVALCMGEAGAHGPCWGKTPAQVGQMMIDAAATTAAEAPNSVFNGSPTRAIGTKYYGNMASTDFPSATGMVPVNTAYPTVSGSATYGSTLTATRGTWTGTSNTYTYDWVRCPDVSIVGCRSISGANAATYTVAAADAGKYLRIRIIASNADGAQMMRSTATPLVSGPVAPSNTSYPAISGTATVGGTLTATAGSWSGTQPITTAQQWLRCTTTAVTSCTAISGATSASYTLVQADRGTYIRMSVTATNLKGSTVMRSYATAAVTGPSAPGLTVSPLINATAAASTASAGVTLRGSQGTWSGTATITYTAAWLRCTDLTVASCVAISGATGSTYTTVAADRGRVVRYAVTATNSVGSVTARSYAMTIR